MYKVSSASSAAPSASIFAPAATRQTVCTTSFDPGTENNAFAAAAASISSASAAFARYGLLAREVIALLKHLQHAPGKTVIFVGVLERIVDEFNREHWQPQMEGGKAARELPAIVDQVVTMSLFEPDGDGWRHEPSKGQVRRLVCRSGNPYALPAKDRSGRLDLTEPADLGALLAKINRTARSA